MTWFYLLRRKSDVFLCFKMFHKMVATQIEAKIEFLELITEKNKWMVNSNYLAENGIVTLITCVDAPAQNGVVKRKNRHLFEVARVLMFSMRIPKSYWGNTVLTATYFIYRTPSSALDYESLIEFLMGTIVTHPIPPKGFGCACFIHGHGNSRGS